MIVLVLINHTCVYTIVMHFE